MSKIYKLRTPFEVQDIPLSEYPRPQFARDSYFTLNGKWQYGIYKNYESFKGYQGEILVPFSPESLLSGLKVNHILKPDEKLYYAREFTLPQDFLKTYTFLNFGAVDCICRIYINGQVVGSHTGGYTPFTIDITKAIQPGLNTIELIVEDPTDTSYHARAKQKQHHGGIWYTPQSGIWQSVWIESVQETYLKDMTIIPDIDTDTINLKLDIEGEKKAEVIIFDDDKAIVQQSFDTDDIHIKLHNYQYWSPENPKLYNIAIKVGGDIVKSYFGMRKFGIIEDENGIKRLALNNKPYFHKGVLDQGYWSDGMLTPPSNEALLYDVKLIKSMGFNMIRKHIKIEPMLWYYYCDKEGILVWQDMVSGGNKYNFLTIGILPNLNIHLDDTKNRTLFARKSEEGRDEYMKDMYEEVYALKNCVSLCMWVPFNEGWGQFDSVKVTKELKSLDNTRTIDSTSGWHDQGANVSDFKSLHIYFRPITLPRHESRCILLSEFGGYSYQIPTHSYSSKKFGYRIYKDQEKLFTGFKNLYLKELIPKISKGLSATVYTQVSDVENEINGLITYDRKVIKYPIESIKELNDKLTY